MCKNLSFIILLLLISSSILAQNLFVDEKKWLNEEERIAEYSEVLKIDTGRIGSNDSLIYQVFDKDQNILVMGHYSLDKYGKGLKIGVWKYFYSSGKLQSERKYNSKGALSEIVSLLSPSGDSLALGYPHRNKDGTYYGHLYQYDDEGKLAQIVRYSQGFLVDQFGLDRYEDERLERSTLRRYIISDDEYIDELTFDEAVSAMKKDPKPIFLRATNSWNGWSRKMNQIYAIPSVAKLIKDNFHIAYLDLAEDREMKFEHNGEMLSFAPNSTKSRNMSHSLITDLFKQRVTATPTYFLIDTDLNLIAKSKGASTTEEKALRHLRYYTDRHYKVMSYEAYEKSDY